jgi:GNAT superfamily N-acetyltransferase
MRIARLIDLVDASMYLDAVATWMIDASSPYLPWLLGGVEATRRLVLGQLRQPVSELSADASYVLLENGRCLGGFVAFAGSALGTARRADVRAIVRGAQAVDRKALSQRLELARDMFLPVPSDCFYLSRIGVLEEARGRGLGTRLMDEYLQIGSRNGFRRFRLDISDGNAAAAALCARHRFASMKPVARAPDFGYLAMERTDHGG